MHTKLNFFKGGHACPLLILVLIIAIIISSFCVTSTDVKPTDYEGKGEWKTHYARRNIGYWNSATGETRQIQKTTGIIALKEVKR